jgi:hypothetical protein
MDLSLLIKEWCRPPFSVSTPGRAWATFAVNVNVGAPRVVGWIREDFVEVGAILSYSGEMWIKVIDLNPADPKFFDELSAALEHASKEIYKCFGKPKTENHDVPVPERIH